MVEYIDRGAVIAKLKQMKFGEHSLVERLFADGVYTVLATAPSVNVAPVVHGRWEIGNPNCPVCGKDKFKNLDADIWADWQPKYCPNCGAKMDVDEEDE